MPAALRFGVMTIQDEPWPTLAEQWRRIDALGYDSIWIADHFADPFEPTGDWLDGWTLLAALATQTSRAAVGTLVTNFFYYDRPGWSPDKHLTRAMLERVATDAIPRLRSEAAPHVG